MAEQIYKINEAIDIGYQAPNKESGLTVISEIYLPNKTKNSYFPNVILEEVGNSGTYRGTFTPNELGTWQVITAKAGGDSQVTRSYSVGDHNVHSLGVNVADLNSDVAVVDGNVDAVKTKTDALPADPASEGNVDAAESNIRGTDSDTLKTLSDQIDGVEGKVDAIDTPPMAF